MTLTEELLTKADWIQETRKADRAWVIAALTAMCDAYGIDHGTELHFLGNSRAIAITITGPRWLEVTIDLDGDSPQPDVYVLSWHISFDAPPEERKGQIIAKGFAQDRNEYHRRKATDICHGARELLVTMEKRLIDMKSGKAIEETNEQAEEVHS